MSLLLVSSFWAQEVDSVYIGNTTTQNVKLHKNAVKITFISWFSGSSKISYERAWPKLHQTSEVTASLIGAGYDKYHNNPLGYTVRYAHKFMLAPWKKYATNTYWHPFSGFYLRSELMYIDYDYDSMVSGERTNSRMGAITGTFGFQYDVKHFLIDANFGSGYCWGKVSDTGYEHGFSVWDYFGHRNDHLAMTFTVKVGYAW